MMQVNHRYYQDLTPEKVDALIDAARELAARDRGAARASPFGGVWSEQCESGGS